MSAPATRASATRFPPGPRAAFPGHNLYRLQRDPIGFLREARRAHGDVAGFRIGRQPIVLLSAPASSSVTGC